MRKLRLTLASLLLVTAVITGGFAIHTKIAAQRKECPFCPKGDGNIHHSFVAMME